MPFEKGGGLNRINWCTGTSLRGREERYNLCVETKKLVTNLSLVCIPLAHVFLIPLPYSPKLYTFYQTFESSDVPVLKWSWCDHIWGVLVNAQIGTNFRLNRNILAGGFAGLGLDRLVYVGSRCLCLPILTISMKSVKVCRRSGIV